MKSTFSLIAFLAFSALILAPKMPKEYPPKAVLEQRESIVFKEMKIDRMINKIEYHIAEDSIQIILMKNEQSKTN